MSRPLAVLDSGIGGLPYLSWLQKNLPQEPLVYVADTAHFPYGEKTPEQVQAAVLGLGRALVDRYQPKLLVVACNTASVLALEVLRAALPIPVVGVVPAGKTGAVLGTRTLAVLATGTAGFVFSWLRRRSGSLIAPIALHWSLNGLGALAAALVWHFSS